MKIVYDKDLHKKMKKKVLKEKKERPFLVRIKFQRIIFSRRTKKITQKILLE
jgi:hypothetical protein